MFIFRWNLKQGEIKIEIKKKVEVWDRINLERIKECHHCHRLQKWRTHIEEAMLRMMACFISASERQVYFAARPAAPENRLLKMSSTSPLPGKPFSPDTGHASDAGL
jgi:hypothetical protein